MGRDGEVRRRRASPAIVSAVSMTAIGGCSTAGEQSSTHFFFARETATLSRSRE